MARYKQGDIRFELRWVVHRCWGAKNPETDKCFITGETENLTHHHCGLSFREILEKAHEDLGIRYRQYIDRYTEEEYTAIKYTVLGYHYLYVEPVTLTKEIHKELHDRYGERPSYDDLLALKKEYESRINNNVEEIA